MHNYLAFERANAPSVLWLILGVVTFIVFVTIVTVSVTKMKQRAKRQREEGLYQSLIAQSEDDEDEYGT